MAELDNIASELLKSANEADKIYAKTRDQSQRDKAVRLRRIVENLKNIVLGASDLNGLSDVTISAAANGQVLTYNSTTTQWENQTPASGGGGDMLKCFHPDTELLTLNGWKKITEISFDDEVATLNQETKQLEYQVPNHIFKYEYDGELIGRETKQLSYLVTPNHRMYVRKWYGGQRGLTWSENFYWERADEVSEKIRSFPITAKWTGVKTETNPFGIDDDLFLEFLGWFLSEGCVVDTKIYVTQTKSKTIAECTRVMVDMARSLGRTLGHNQNAHFNFRHSELAKFLSQFGKHAHNKFIPAFVKNLPAEKLILFYNAYYKGDGHLNGNNITTVSKRMADDLQEVILKLGGYATITKCPPAITSYGVRDFYRLNCNFNNLQGTTAKKDNYKVEYKGFVHCVEVDNATLYTRFNGKPVFLGNSTYDVDNDGIVDGSETTQIIVRNSTGVTLTKGQVVYLSGATGNRPNAVLSQANTEATSSKTIGIVIANIANNSDGYVAVNGTLHDLDTSAFTAGDAVWLSATTAGAYTSTIPAEPNHTVFIGYVARSHPTQGRLVIAIQNGYELNELHGVLISAEANNDLLVYESSSTLWKNKSISTIFGGTPLVSVPTLAQVTTAGNTTTNAITVGGLNVNGIQVITSADVANRDVGPAAFNITNGTFSRFDVVYDASVARMNILGTSTEGLRIEAGSSTTISKTGTGGLTISAPSNNLLINGASLLFYTISNERARITTSGNFLIGTTTDAGYKLDVNGTVRFQDHLIFSSGKGMYTSTSTTALLSSTNYFTHTRLASSGTMGFQIGYVGSVNSFWRWNDGTGDVEFGNAAGYGMHFYTNNLSRIFINALGSVGVATTTVPAKFNVSGSITAASALAQGVYFNNTLVAAANNDVLVGLDINPTFTNGAFTGVTNYAIRTIGDVRFQLAGYPSYGLNITNVITGETYISKTGASTNLIIEGTQGVNISPTGNVGIGILGSAIARTKLSVFTTIGTSPPALGSSGGTFSLLASGSNGLFGLLAGVVNSTGDAWFQAQRVDATATAYNILLQPTGGNVLIGTTTDAGYKLDVNGTFRAQGSITATLASTTTANVVYYNTSTGLLTYGAVPSGTVTSITAGTGLSGGTITTSGTIALANTAVTAGAYTNADITVDAQGRITLAANGSASQWTTTGSDIYYNTGNVGIGTASPTDILHIVSGAAANIFGRISSTNANGTAAWVAQNDQTDNVVYRVFGSGASGTQMGIALARTASLIANLGGSGSFLLGTYSATNFIMGTGNAEKMRIVDSTGNILIATTTDLGNKLEVSGTINSTGYKINNTAGYTGILNIVTNPPGMQNIDIQSGIIVNIF